jgi:Tfp pilus assembly protein PilF
VLFFLLWHITGAFWRSAAAAALFAVHPLRVESVAWVAERKDLLGCLFFLLALWCYADWVRARPAKRSYALALVCFVLALASKPTVVTLPFVLLLVDYWPLERREPLWPRVREKLPFFALAAASSVLTYIGQKRWGAMEELAFVPFPARVANALVAYARYLRDVFWPQTLALPYPYRADLPPATVWLAAAVVAAITGAVIWQARRRYLPTGWFWFVGALVPMIGLVQVGHQSRADRFTYIPFIGLCLLIVWGAAELAGRFAVGGGTLAAISTVVILALAARSRAQVEYWQNTETIFEHTVAVTRDNRLAHYNLGYYYLLKNRPAQAEPHLREVIRLNPAAVNSFKNLGKALFDQGRFAEALPMFTEAVRLRPDFAVAIMDRAVTLNRLGRHEEALAGFQQALARGLPDVLAADAHNHLGALLVGSGRLDEGVASLRDAVRLNPRLDTAHMNLARTLMAVGQDREALEHVRIVVTHNPRYPGAYEDLLELSTRLGAP